MKVVFDVSIFGAARESPLARSGVFRMTENIVGALARSGKCSLSFSAMEEFLHYEALNELLLYPQFGEIPFFHSRLHFYLLSRFQEAGKKVDKVGGWSRRGWRIRRKVLGHALAKGDSLFGVRKMRFDEAGLRTADVFHSPYYAIPTEVRKERRLCVFLTVHDLIPILHPQYFDAPPPGGQHCSRTIIDGIGKEDWIICVSHSTKEDLCNYRPDLDPRRVAVTHLGAAEWFRPCQDAAEIEAARSRYKIPAGEYFLSVCTLEPRKNLAHLIRSFLQLIRQERLAGVYLVLVGSLGWKYEAILAEITAAEPGMRERIVLTGRVEDGHMAALYSGCQAFVYPSLYEGFGLPPLEAMQCGAPVIVGNNSSMPEVVGEAGVLVDSQDAIALGEAMLRIISNRVLRETISRKSIEQAKLFSWDICASKTLDFYHAAVNSR